MIIRSKHDGEEFTGHGLDGMHVWRLIGRAETGAERITCEITEFAPGASHPVHRHPHAEQVHFIVSGSGQRILADGSRVPQGAGEIALIPAGEWHGFVNDSDEVTVVLSALGGVSDPAEAGLELPPEAPDASGAPPPGER